MGSNLFEPKGLYGRGNFSLPLGILMAWILVRCRFPGKTLLDSIIHLPLVLPPVVVGYLLLISMGRRGFIGEWLYDWFGFSFTFSWRGAALASAVVAFPLMVRAIRLALEAVDQRLEQAARTLRASPIKVFHYHLTAFLAGDYRWCCTGICSLVRRIWRHNYLCF